MLTVGLTGGIGAGKSEALRLLAAAGAVTIDADRLAREAVAPGTPGLAAVVEEFGPGILTPAGELDRERLGRIVFADEQRRRALNAIVHPLVAERRDALRSVAAAADPDAIVVEDVPLLAENQLQDRYDAVVVVDAAEATRLARLTRLRGMTAQDARARMAAQATREQRLKIADFVLDNDGAREDLQRQVAALWLRLRRLASGG